MSFLRGKHNKNRWISFCLLLALFTVLPQAVWAGVSGESINDNNRVVIVRDHQSGAVIYRHAGKYYYGLPAPTPASLIGQGEVAPGEIIIRYKQPSGQAAIQSSLPQTVRQAGAMVRPIDAKLGMSLVKLTAQSEFFTTLRALLRNPDVAYAEPNYIARIAQTPNDPYYDNQWGARDIHADIAWDKVPVSQRTAVTLAVLDTGINIGHEDFQGNIIPGYNFINNNTTPMDGNGHGSHVAGIAAAIDNNGKGIAGIAGGVKIMPVKVMDDSGAGDYASIINGIRYAVDHGAQVISLSLGGSGFSQAMQDAVDYATQRGVSVVAASGNSGGPVSFPANCKGVIAVGAVASNNQRASFSSYGPELDVVAPGVNIISAYKNGASGYVSMSGTSMATPFVSGVAALVKAANPGLSATAVADAIERSATDLGTAGFDNYYGYGLVDANKAVDMALRGQTKNPISPPAPAPIPVPAPPGSLNLASHKTAVASSVEGGTRTAGQAVDGNIQTRWASQAGIDPQWIYVDLGKSYQIDKIVLKWEAAFAKAYQIYTSNDGQNWTGIYSTNYGSGGSNTLNVSGQGRYVLLYGLQRGTSYGYSLWEFEVYGK